MSELDWEKIRSTKQAYRDRLAALSFAEKLAIVERLQERAREMRGGSVLPVSATERSVIGRVFIANNTTANTTMGTANIGMLATASALLPSGWANAGPNVAPGSDYTVTKLK